MDRTVNLKILNAWLARNGGVGELAHKSRVSPHTIMKMKNRARPVAPRKMSTQSLLAEALGVTIEELFPSTESPESKTG